MGNLYRFDRVFQMAAFAAVFLLSATADSQISAGLGNADIVSPTQSAEESAARQALADDNFSNIVAPQQAVDFGVQKNLRAPNAMPAEPFPPPRPRASAEAPVCEANRSAEMPLEDYTELLKRLGDHREQLYRIKGPNVTLGASRFSGSAVQDALELTLELQITLGDNDEWKTVPIIGDDVVLLKAEVDGATIPVARQNGYIVWPTRRSGELTVRVGFLAPSRGPRGSLEYDFLIARTPVTRFSCRFPGTGLEPRLAAAQEAKVTSDGASSMLEATLKPTTRIHLVGYKDIGEGKDEEALLFAESMSLLSVEEGALEVFAVIRYTILYGGAKQFEVRIPDGMTVISADGEGAFRYAVEAVGESMVLRGETAFPIRNNYEISLRLRRKTDAEGMVFKAPVPRPLDVEREHGWLAVEVPGKLKIEEKSATDITALDVRQLPPEMVKSAVSPIIRAYRYHSPTAEVQLSYEKLPEQEPASASVDRIRAFSVVSEDGKMLTDMKIRLRNRLRPQLALRVPPEVEVLSVHLDGEAVRPSRDEKGRLILPLKRSEGGDNLKQITLQTVMESRVDAFQMAGKKTLALPAVDLPTAVADWTVFLPARNVYSGLDGDIARQQYVSEAKWFTSPYSSEPVRVFEPAEDDQAALETGGAAATGAGVVSVRIELPKTGMALDYSRYWIGDNQPVQVSLCYVRSWLMIPAVLLLVLLLAVGVALFTSIGAPERGRGRAVLGIVLSLLPLVPLYKYAGPPGVAAGVFLGILVAVLRSQTRKALPAALADWSKTFWERFKARDRAPGKTVVLRFLTGTGIAVFGLMLLSALMRFAYLLFHPL